MQYIQNKIDNMIASDTNLTMNDKYEAYLKIISAIDQGIAKETHFLLTMRVV